MDLLEKSFPEPVQRCVAGAREKGVEVEARIFDNELPTAKAAAHHLGINEAQITNSLIFEIKASKTSRMPILVCSSGDRRVDVKKLAGALGVSKNKIKSASASTVLQVTGYGAGGVGPVGFLMPLHAAFVEERCFMHEHVWCGAGVKQAMLRCSPTELLALTGGVRANLAVDETEASQPSLQDAGVELSVDDAGGADGGASSTSEPSSRFLDTPTTLEEQISSVGDGSLRWFPERAFDFCEAFYQKQTGNPTSIATDRTSTKRLLPTVVIEQDPGHVGGIVWDAEVVLAHHIADAFATSSATTSHDCTLPHEPKTTKPLAGKRVIELGAGTGLAGLVCGLLGADHVVLTELPEALGLLRRNADRTLPQKSEVKGRGVGAGCAEGDCIGGGSAFDGDMIDGLCSVCELSWGEKGYASALELAPTLFRKNAPFDLVLVADCVYIPELYQDLADTVRALSGPHTQVLVAFEQRRRDISGFFAHFDNDSANGLTSEGAPSAGRASEEGGACGFDSEKYTPQFSSENLPGSDGRRPHGNETAPRTVDLGAGGGSLPDKLVTKLTWVDSPLLRHSYQLAKIHLAQITFEGGK